MVIETTAADLKAGDVLLNNGATVLEAVPSHHGTKVYLRAQFDDGYVKVDTVDASLSVPTWVQDGAGCEDETLAQETLRDMGVSQ